MDVFIVTILYQCKTQLTIVRNNFESLPERARSSLERSGLNFDAVLHESFVDCLVHYKKITDRNQVTLFHIGPCWVTASHFSGSANYGDNVAAIVARCCSLLETIFGSALLVQFGLGSWTLCMATYKIVSLNLLSIEFTSTMLFIICIGLELLLYCHFGNE
ncbi:Odorant receptor, partial [Operophtera brumata]